MKEQELRISFSVDESAKMCGLCSKTIWEKIHTGELRAARVGSRVLIIKSDLEAWLNSLADTSGTLVRPDLSESVITRNRMRRKIR